MNATADTMPCGIECNDMYCPVDGAHILGSVASCSGYGSKLAATSSQPQSFGHSETRKRSRELPSSQKAWGSLRPMTDALVPRKSPSVPFQYLVVLDFEWTADNRRPMLPVSEITQFPSVLVRLQGRASVVVDEFNSYVRPILNPRLTPFSIELTGITQDMVDASPPLQEVLPQYLEWLRQHGLLCDRNQRKGAWAFCTWSDADIGGQLSKVQRGRAAPLLRPVGRSEAILSAALQEGAEGSSAMCRGSGIGV